MEKLLELLEKDASLATEQLAVMLDSDSGTIAVEIKEYKKKRVNIGYKTIINREKTENEPVSAIIELRATPQLGEGFDEIAKRVFPFVSVTGLSSDAFAEKLLRSEKIAVVPGKAFGDSGEGFFRCSYAYSIASINEAPERIDRFVNGKGVEVSCQ